MAKKRKGENKTRDRMSALPDSLRQHILSFLSTKDAIATCSLSRTWQFDWTRVPFLYLGENDSLHRLLQTGAQLHNIGVQQHLQKSLQYVHFLNSVLRQLEQQRVHQQQQNPVILRQLRVCIPCLHALSQPMIYATVEQLLALPSQGLVKELRIDIGARFWNLNPHRNFLFRLLTCLIFRSETLHQLELKGVTFFESSKEDINTMSNYRQLCRSMINLPSLRKLFLYGVRISPRLLKDLLSSCPSIEELQIWLCPGFDFILTSALGLSKLSSVLVRYGDPNVPLKRFGFECNVVTLRRLILEIYYKEPFLWTLNTVRSCCINLVELQLHSCPVDDDTLNALLVQLPHLEHLELSCCNLLEHIIIRSAKLESLTITSQALHRVDLDSPNLLSFKCTDHNTKDTILLNSKTPLSTVEYASIYLSQNSYENKWYPKLLDLLARLSHSKHVHLTVITMKNLIVPQELLQSFCTPLSATCSLKLSVMASVRDSYEFTQFLDSVLWLFPSPKCMHIRDLFDDITWLRMRLQYEEGMKDEGCGCYSSLPINCWRHSVKNLEILEQHAILGDETLAKWFQRSHILIRTTVFFKKKSFGFSSGN